MKRQKVEVFNLDRHIAKDRRKYGMQRKEDGRKMALIIGNSIYEHLRQLPACKNDVNDLEKVLKSNKYDTWHIIKKVDTNKKQMANAIQKFFYNPKLKSEDLVLFYFTGHGIISKNGVALFANSQTTPDNGNTGFLFSDLIGRINDSESKKIVLIIDCCYSGTTVLDIAMLSKHQKSKVLLAASLSYEQAFIETEGRNSLFTSYLLQGLEKNAAESVNSNGDVTPSSLGDFIFEKFSRLREKRPNQNPIVKAEITEKVILAHFSEYAEIADKNALNLLIGGNIEEFNKYRDESHNKLIDFDRENLEGNNKLQNVNLSNVRLRSANLTKTDLRSANLSKSYLSAADLSNSNLSNSNLSNSNLSNALLLNTNLSGNSKLSHALLSGADLSYANLSYADLSYADLSRADLSGAHFLSARLLRANLSSVSISDVKLKGFKFTNDGLSKASICDASISDVKLKGFKFNSADLYRVNLSDADLSETDFSNAKLTYANLSYANLSKADLSDANLSYANLSDANLSYADLSYADLSHALLSGANLTHAIVAGANTSNAYELNSSALLSIKKRKRHLRLITTIPHNGTTEFPVGSYLGAIFNHPIDIFTVNDSFTLKKVGKAPKNVQMILIKKSPDLRSVLFAPSDDGKKPSPLDPGATYIARTTPKVKDIIGNALKSDIRWSFTTARDSSFKKLDISDVSASDHDSNGPTNVIDNDNTNRWSCYGLRSWINVGLGKTKNVCGVSIAWHKGDRRRYKFEISIDDNKPIFSDTSSGLTLDPERYFFDLRQGRCVKITVDGNTQNNWASIKEINIYGH